MWICFSCDRHFEYLEETRCTTCPHCGSTSIQKVLPRGFSARNQEDSCGSCGQGGHPTCGFPSVLSDSQRPRVDDSVVVASLEHCGIGFSQGDDKEKSDTIGWPEIFNLVWGIQPMVLEAFSEEHRKVVADILLEETKGEESDDPIEKKLHHIITELLYVEYRKNINDYVIKAATKRMNAHNRRR